MSTLYSLLQLFFVISGIIMIVLVLFRKGEMGGLSGAFGGLGGDTAFGVKTQKQLDKIITYVSVFFIITAILLSTPKFRKAGKEAVQLEPPVKKEAPAAPVAPPTPPADNK